MFRKLLAGVMALGLWNAVATAQPSLETDEDKTLYALGVALGSNLESFDLSATEMRVIAAGIHDAALGNELRVDMQTYGPRIQAFAGSRAAAGAAAEREASTAYVGVQAGQPGAERTASGLVYIPITAGTGPSPRATDTVLVHYHGTLRDGSVFDSSVERGEPISFALSSVIPCWTEGVQKMQVGGKARLVCPPETAYGDAGQGPIPGGAALAFEVELLDIETD